MPGASMRRRVPSQTREPSRRLAHQSDHDAEDFERALGTDDRICLVLGAQDEVAAIEIETLERKLIVDDGDDDVAASRRGAFLDDDEIAVENSRVLHRISLDPYENRLRGSLDQ